MPITTTFALAPTAVAFPRFIQHRPWIAAIGALGVLLALAAPFLGIRFGFPDAQNDPESYTTHRAYELITDGFGPGYSAPLVLTVQGESGTELRTSTNAVGRRCRTGWRTEPWAAWQIHRPGRAPVLLRTVDLDGAEEVQQG